jgi:hypothetical protein
MSAYQMLEDLRYRAESLKRQEKMMDPDEVLTTILTIYHDEGVTTGWAGEPIGVEP